MNSFIFVLAVTIAVCVVGFFVTRAPITGSKLPLGLDPLEHVSNVMLFIASLVSLKLVNSTQ